MRLRNIPEAKGIVAESRHVIRLQEVNGRSIPDFLHTDMPVEMEIGMGKGAFVIGMAQSHPDRFFIGVERYESVLMRAVQKMDALEKAEREGTEPAGTFPRNLKFLCEDAASLPEWFPEGSVGKLYLNFSDPWPKARHEKRRLTSGFFLSIYERFLKPGGELVFKTDNEALFAFSVETMRSAEHWTLKTVTNDLHRTLAPGEENIMTEYERKFSNLGSKICRMTAVYNGRDDSGAIC